MSTAIPALTAHALAILLAALRIAPLVAFAPPFNMVRVPAIVLATIVVALAADMPGAPTGIPIDGRLVGAAVAELALGLALALPLQLAFALIGMAGRMLDIQAGFGLAFLIDPKTKTQVPLIGALFTYAAGAIFFLTSGPADVVAVLAAGFERMPAGSAILPDRADDVLQLLAAGSIVALGVVGLGVLALFLIDLVIAMMSRTLPQMNVLVLGFQIKSLAVMLLLPATIGLGAASMMRLIRLAVETMARLS